MFYLQKLVTLKDSSDKKYLAICHSEACYYPPRTGLTSEMFYHIPTLPIAVLIFGKEIRDQLDLSSIHYLLYAMDWDNRID